MGTQLQLYRQWQVFSEKQQEKSCLRHMILLLKTTLDMY